MGETRGRGERGITTSQNAIIQPTDRKIICGLPKYVVISLLRNTRQTDRQTERQKDRKSLSPRRTSDDVERVRGGGQRRFGESKDKLAPTLGGGEHHHVGKVCHTGCGAEAKGSSIKYAIALTTNQKQTHALTPVLPGFTTYTGAKRR